MDASVWFRFAVGGAAMAVGLLTTGAGLAQVNFTTGSRIPEAAPKPDPIKAAADAASRMTVPVLVNGQGPFAFVIDTGADRTVVSRELATRLDLKPGDPVLLNGTGGVDLTPTARIDDLKVGRRELHDVSAPALAASNLGAEGMLGIDSLRDQRMVMDFQRRLMLVEPSRHRFYGADVIVVHAKSRYGQLVLVDASVNGSPLAVILDSGAQNTIGNLALRRAVEGFAKPPGELPVDVISVSGRTTPAQFANLAQVQLGGMTLHNVPIAFADLHTFAEFGMNDRPAMLLGMDVLRLFDRVAVDFGRKEVSFQTPLGG